MCRDPCNVDTDVILWASIYCHLLEDSVRVRNNAIIRIVARAHNPQHSSASAVQHRPFSGFIVTAPLDHMQHTVMC